jgi:dTMP kinase
METGRFITLEGGEGAGKTTQASRIKSTLEDAGIEVVITREPGGTFGAEAIRDLVLGGSHERWSGLTELLLMYAARLDHVEKLIKPALARGVWVLCDRFNDSSMAYQGYARGLGRERVAAIDDVVLQGFKPDLTILFDIDPILAQRRVKTRGEDLSRFDTEDLEFHKTLQAAFLDIAERNPDRFRIVDATLSRSAIETQIKHVLMKHFPGLRLG